MQGALKHLKNLQFVRLAVGGGLVIGWLAVGFFFPILRIGFSAALPVAVYVLLRRYRFPEEPVFPDKGKKLSKKYFFVFFALVAVSVSLMLFYRFLDWLFNL